MNTNDSRRNIGRKRITAVIALAMVLSAVGFTTPLAQAVTLGTLTTRMEIDGNKANAAGFDWNDILDGTLPAGYAGAGFTSAGIVDASYVIDSPGTIAGACALADATVFPGSQTIHTNPWVIGPTINPPTKKGDLCTGAAALEVIDVGGDLHYILYQYWTRDPDSTGDVSMFQILEGPLPGRCDDRLLESNYDPSGSPATTFAAYSWQATSGNCAVPGGSGTWQPTSITGVQAVGANPDKGVNPNADTFGESAIDLTANGIVPSDRCVTFTSSGFISRTGNAKDNTSQNIDSLNFTDPIVFNNCATVSISKVTQPAGFGSNDSFTYKLDQLAGTVHDSTLLPSLDSDGSFASITDTIQSGQTDTWSNVIAQPDYRLAETVLPTNWSLQQISCTFWDPFFVDDEGQLVPQLRTVTSSTSPLSPFAIPPSITKPAGQPNTACTITNATSGIRLVKAGSGDADQTFNFTMTDKTVPALKLGESDDFAFAPGTDVSITETLPVTTPAWQLTNVECTLADGTVVGTVTGTQVDVETVAGEVITCTYTNDQMGRIVVDKTGTGSTGQTFGFEQSWDGNTDAGADFTLALGASSNSGDLAPGIYTVAELVPATMPAWLLSSITCSDDAAGANQSTSTIANPTATITLQAGDTVNCTFTNNQQGRLVIVKNTVGADGTFSFSGPIASVTTAGNTGTVGLDVAPGTYPVAETVPAGWELTSSSCNQGRTLPNVVVSAGQTVTCTFNNTKLGKIIVSKQTLPASSSQQFTFDGSWSGVGTDLTLSNGQSGDSGFLTPGTYSVAETAIPAGWDMTSATCSDGSDITAIEVDANETVTCTFQNTQRGNIVIVKNSGVAAGSFAFTQTWSSGTGATTPFTINTTAPSFTNQQDFSNVVPGSYTVIETDPSASFDLKSVQCVDGAGSTTSSSPTTPVLRPSATVNVDPGETVVCTFNNSKKGTIVIIKDAQPNLPAAFPFTASAPLSNFSIIGSDSQAFSNITATEVNGTTYPVVEGTTAGWILDSIDCSNTASTTDLATRKATISVGPGETVVCTFTNSAVPATLSLTKAVSGVDPTYPWTFDFTLSPPGAPSGTRTFAGTGNAVTAPQTWTGLVPGQSYTLAEEAPPGWISSISCTLTAADATITTSTALPFSFIAQPGQTINCAAANAAVPATLDVTKSVTGLDPSADWGPFTITLTPGATPASDVVTKADPIAEFTGLVPGTSYSLGETLAPGWVAGTFSCSVTPAGSNTATPVGAPPISVHPGDHIACGITNTAQPATLQVIKTAVGAGGDFTFPVSGLASPISISLAAQGVQASATVNLVPGAQYGVSEADLDASWIKGIMTCTYVAADGSTGSVAPSTFTPTPGEAVTCRITNTKKGNIVIAKSAVGGDATFSFTGTAGGSINTATGATDSYTLSNVDPAAYTATETPLAGWDLTALSCNDTNSTVNLGAATASIDVSPGETVTCSYTNTKRGTITVDKVVVPATDTRAFDFTFNGQPFSLTGDATPFSSGLIVPGTYVINEPAIAGWVLTGLECVGQQASIVETAGPMASIQLAAGENVDCTYTNSRRGPVQVLKTLTNGPTLVSDNVYTVGYDLAVTSQSTVDELYDLADVLGFGAGTTIVTATLTTVDGPAPTVAGWNGVAQTQIHDDATINPVAVDADGHKYHVTVTFAVAGSMTTTARDCLLVIGETGTGTLNTASVTSALGANISSACGVIPDPVVTLDKSISDGPARNADGSWTIEYTVTVANSGAGPAEYSLNDTFGFGAGVTVTNVAVTTSPVGLAFSASNSGVTTTGTQLNAGATHVYTITVDATIAVDAETNGDCANGGGFANTAAVSTNHAVANASVCAPFSTLTLLKTVVNDDGGTLVSGDVTLTASGPATITGKSPVASAIPAGQYVLRESPVPGYSTNGYDCGANVNVAAGANVVCTIVNDDVPVDLQITKSDGGAEPLAGETFTYTLNISNLGTRDADLGEPVVVTDILPAGVVWVLPLPANCNAAGQVVTCGIDPADLQVGESVTIVLQAMITDIAAPTTFTNKAFVTTADDPACVGEGCVPPCVPTIQAEVVSGTNPSNNVACEDTPARVLTDVQIVKSTSTPNLLAGSVATFTLVVSNLGPNTARDVSIVDPIPTPLVLQTVTSSDFICTSAANSIVCTRPVLLVGDVGTITITALVPANAVAGSTIVNTATVRTVTPETNLVNNEDSTSVVPFVVASQAPPLPPVIPPTVPPDAQLPRTGFEVGMMLRLAALLAATGILALVTTRRRRETVR